MWLCQKNVMGGTYMFTRKNKINKEEDKINESRWETKFLSFNPSKVNKLTLSPSLL